MYRLVLYILLVLWGAALALSFGGFLSFSAVPFLYSSFIILGVSLAANFICAKFLNLQTNTESVYITALILILIISPPAPAGLWQQTPFLIWAAVLAQGSKYILNIGGKHLFNPAALAVAITSLTLGYSASWWVGTAALAPFTIIGSILIIQKLRKWGLAIAFLLAALGATVLFGVLGDHSLGLLLKECFLYSPLFFFAGVMLTEPATMPPTIDGRLAFGLLIGFLFSPQTNFHLGTVFFTPELALLTGNIFAYIISPKGRHVLRLKEKKWVGAGVYDFIFQTKYPIKFKPGQYMEWTLGHKKPDNRGNRRYFTIASSPTEPGALLGVKFYGQPSSFKQTLAQLAPGDEIVAGQLAGDFTLPANKNQKIVFLAGGIGITPFRSMIKYLVDKNERRDIALFYSNRTAEEVAYYDIFDEAQNNLGIKTVYTLTDKNQLPKNWGGEVGHVNRGMISKEVPDYKERIFYISGSQNMVDAFKAMLLSMGVNRTKIKTDFFPGLV